MFVNCFEQQKSASTKALFKITLRRLESLPNLF